VFSSKVRGASKSFIKWATDDEDGTWTSAAEGRRYKSRLQKRSFSLKGEDGTKTTVEVDERVIVVFTDKFKRRDRAKRQEIREYLERYIDSPAAYKAAIRKGSKKYLKVEDIDTDTGEITSSRQVISIDEGKWAADELCDGYWCVVTSETDMPVEDVLSAYQALWRIEESFRIIKSDLEGRPVYVRNEHHINAHFLICFIALAIQRIIQLRCAFSIPAGRTIEALRSARCHPLGSGMYRLEPQSPDLIAIMDAFGTSLDKANASLEDIRRYVKLAKRSAKTKQNTTSD
jgi:hypothetical protein